MDTADGGSSAGESGADPAVYSRRAMLKRGAVVGGALVWTIPAIQVISMNVAQAEGASAPPRGPKKPKKPKKRKLPKRPKLPIPPRRP